MSEPIRVRRRLFIGGAGVAALTACERKSPPTSTTLTKGRAVAAALASAPTSVPRGGSVPRRALGKTGETVSVVGLGGYHVGLAKDESAAARIIHSAIDRGVTFMDNSWDYHGGMSEEWMGKALTGGYRNRVLLMTKIDGRTKKAAAEQLEQSLRRLRTDVIDLVQIHEVIRDSDAVRSFGEGGCIEALVEAKAAGKIRFIGFTGHKDPSIHLAMLKAADDHHFAFDTVQLPLNVLDAHYRSFEHLVVPVLVSKGIGVLGMKPLAAGKILETKTVNATECLHYAMSLPTSVVITGCDSMPILDQAIQAALSYEPIPPNERAALLDRTRDFAKGGRLERFKTSTDHDGTTLHPEWMESASM